MSYTTLVLVCIFHLCFKHILSCLSSEIRPLVELFFIFDFVCERFLHYIIKLYSICIPVFELLSFFLYTEEKASFYKRFGTFSGRHVVIMRSKDLIEGAWSFGEHTFAVFSQSSKFNLKLKMRKKGWKL